MRVVDQAPEFSGFWNVKHYRGNTLLADFYSPNGITREGHFAMWHYTVAGSDLTPGNSWYVGLVDTAFFDEMRYIDVWNGVTNLSTGPTVFPRWNTQNLEIGRATFLDPLGFPTAAVSGTIISTVATIPILAGSGEGVQGLFITNSSTLGSDNPGVLWSTSKFSSALFVDSGDFLIAQYTLATSFRL